MTTGQKFDVIIIGGGPAGLGSAIHLAEKGMEVLLLEKNKIGLTQKTWLTFDYIVEKYGLEESVRNRFSGVIFSCYLGNTYSFKCFMFPLNGLCRTSVVSVLHDLWTHGSSRVPPPSDRVSDLRSFRETRK